MDPATGLRTTAGIDVSSLNDGLLTATAPVIDGAGNSSPPGTVTATKITVPVAPTGISAVFGCKGASVSFTPPADNGTGTVTSYTATATPTVGTIVHVAPGSSSPIIFPHVLAVNASYRFSVHANNAVGAGAESLPTAPVLISPCG